MITSQITCIYILYTVVWYIIQNSILDVVLRISEVKGNKKEKPNLVWLQKSPKSPIEFTSIFFFSYILLINEIVLRILGFNERQEKCFVFRVNKIINNNLAFNVSFYSRGEIQKKKNKKKNQNTFNYLTIKTT